MVNYFSITTVTIIIISQMFNNKKYNSTGVTGLLVNISGMNKTKSVFGTSSRTVSGERDKFKVQYHSSTLLHST